MLYIDNPSGVGYSYATRDIDFCQTDLQVSIDAHDMISQFFQAWPELKPNPLYIAGHSYGGVYVPYLAWQIHQRNLELTNEGNLTDVLNLAGTIVANGVVSFITDGFIRNSIENLAAFGNGPLSLLEGYKTLGCEMYDSFLVKSRPIINKLECLEYLKFFNSS